MIIDAYRRYTDFKIYGDKVYFLDCDNSRIQGFGSICYFDINEKFLNDLKIKSGENFLITDKYFIIPSIFESNSTSDIGDIFNQGIGNTKKYILNISIYKKESYELITTFEMGKFIDPHIMIASRIVRNFFEKSHANQAAFCSLSHSIFCSRRVSALM